MEIENKFFKIFSILFLLLSFSFVTLVLIKNANLKKQLALQNSQLETLTKKVAVEVASTPEADFDFDLLKQINEIPKNLTIKKDFKCVNRFDLKMSELSEFELKMYNEFFLDKTKERGTFCTKQGTIVLASYSDSQNAGLILSEEDFSTVTLFQNDVGSVSLANFKLLSWNDAEFVFAVRDTVSSNGMRNLYMLVYHVDIDSLGFAEPVIKVLETCKYGVSPGTNAREYNSCSLLKSNQESAFVDADELR